MNLIAASVMTEDFDLREKTETDLQEKLPSGFWDMNETNIPQALSLNIRNNTEFQVQMNLQSKEIQEVWDETIGCLLKAVDFISARYSAPRLEFVPYEAMLPVLQHLFYVAGEQMESSTELLQQVDHWFWQAAFGNRYGGASQTAMTSDAAALRESVKTQKEFLPLTVTERALVNGSMRATTSAVRNGVLCLLNMRKPRRFDTGEIMSVSGPDFERFTRAESHHVFSSGYLKSHGFQTKEVHWIPNFCYMPSVISKRIGDAPPSQYMADFRSELGETRFAEVMRSHLIPVGNDSGIWNDDYRLFLNQRSELLFGAIQQLCGVRVRIAENKQNAAIDFVEKALRDKIHNTLWQSMGEKYWVNCVQSVGGGKVNANIQGRIGSLVTKNPEISLDRYTDDLRASGILQMWQTTQL